MRVVVLRDLRTNELVDGGANLLLERSLAGPRRSKVVFEPDDQSEARGIGQTLRREGAVPAGGGRLKGTSCRKGWAGLSGGACVAYQTVANGPAAKEISEALVTWSEIREY